MRSHSPVLGGWNQAVQFGRSLYGNLVIQSRLTKMSKIEGDKEKVVFRSDDLKTTRETQSRLSDEFVCSNVNVSTEEGGKYKFSVRASIEDVLKKLND